MLEPGIQPQKKRKTRAITGFSMILMFIFAWALYSLSAFRTIQVSGQSMEPTLHNGDKVLVSRAYWLVGPIKKGDIVVVKSDAEDEYWIKRVYRLQGEVVDFLNVPESWRLSQGEFVVPPGTIYLLGDNYAVSEDSRKYGSVSTDRIIGKVVLRAWRGKAEQANAKE